MYRCGLTPHDFGLYIACLRGSHTSTWVMEVLDTSLSVQRTIGADTILDGQVDVDSSTLPSRKLTIQLLDPGHTMGFHSDNPSTSALFGDKIVRVHHHTWVNDLGAFVSCPIFTGPIRGFQRDGDTVQLSGVGMEAYSLGQNVRAMTLAKGMKKTDAIKRILSLRGGETHLGGIPDLKATLPSPVSLGTLTVPWSQARHIGASMDRKLFYQANGHPVLRTLGSKRVLTFHQSFDALRSSDIVGAVQASLDLSTIDDNDSTSGASGWFNRIEVLGRKTKSGKRIRATSQASDASPLSPTKLGRNGVPLYRMHREENTKLRTNAEAQKRADRLMKDMDRSATQVTADTLIFPFIEEHDLLGIQTVDGVAEFRATQWSIPFTEGQGMSLGYNKRFITPLKHPRPHRTKKAS